MEPEDKCYLKQVPWLLLPGSEKVITFKVLSGRLRITSSFGYF
jgi:hypothetical protein